MMNFNKKIVNVFVFIFNYTMFGAEAFFEKQKALAMESESALHKACRNPNTSKKQIERVINILVADGSLPSVINQRNDLGETPLLLAVGSGKESVVKECLKPMGAFQSIAIADKAGNTPLSLACQRKDKLSFIKYLFDNIPAENRLAVLNKKDVMDKTPLVYAVKQKNFGLIKDFIAAGAPIDYIDENGATLLSIGLNESQGISHIHDGLVELFKKSSHELLLKTNKFGVSVLHYLCKKDNADRLIQEMVKMGDNVNAQDEEGKTPLMHACCSRKSEGTIKFLLENGALATATCVHGKTPLMYVCSDMRFRFLNQEKEAKKTKKDLNIATNLIDRDPNFLFHTDDEGKTAFIYACECNHYEIAILILTKALEKGERPSNESMLCVLDSITKASEDISINDAYCDRNEKKPLYMFFDFLIDRGFITPELARFSSQQRSFLTAFCLISDPKCFNSLERDLAHLDYLISCGANVNGAPHHYYTPLGAACNKDGKEELALRLLDHGADSWQISGTGKQLSSEELGGVEYDCSFPVLVALKNKTPEVLPLLRKLYSLFIEQGKTLTELLANCQLPLPKLHDQFPKCPIAMLNQRFFSLEKKMFSRLAKNDSLLHCAVRENNIVAVKAFLEAISAKKNRELALKKVRHE